MLRGLDPAQRLQAAVSHINDFNGDAECVVVTGDLCYHGTADSYAVLKEVLGSLSMPCHLLIGNHDHREAFKSAFPSTRCDENGYVQYVVQASVGTLVMLDTVQAGSEGGRLCDARLEWLDQQLTVNAESSIFLFLHHPPFDVGIGSLDAMKLEDGEALSEVLGGHVNVRHMFVGHVHRPIWGSWNGIPFSTLPGTNHQVALNLTDDPEMFGTHEPPAYGICLIDDRKAVIHECAFLDRSSRFRFA